MKKKILGVICSSILLGGIVASGFIPQSEKISKVKAAGLVDSTTDPTPNFVDDFSSYGSFAQLNRNWTNAYFTGRGLASVMGAEVFSIATDPDNSSNKVLSIDTASNSLSFPFLTMSNLKVKRFTLSFDYYLREGSNTADSWFGILCRKDLSRDDYYGATSGEMITFQTKTGWDGYKLSANQVESGERIVPHLVNGEQTVQIPVNEWSKIVIASTINAEGVSSFSVQINDTNIGVVNDGSQFYNRFGYVSLISSMNKAYIDNVSLINEDGDDAPGNNGFVEDFGLYNSYSSMGGEYSNSYFDNTGHFTETNSTDVWSIATNVGGAGSKDRALVCRSAVGNHSYTLLTRRNFVTQNFVAHFEYFNYASNNSRGDTWFGLSARRDTSNNNIFTMNNNIMILIKSINGSTKLEVNTSNGAESLTSISISNAASVVMAADGWNKVTISCNTDASNVTTISASINGTSLGSASLTGYGRKGNLAFISSINEGAFDRVNVVNNDIYFNGFSETFDYDSYGNSAFLSKWTNNYLRGDAVTYNSSSVLSIAEDPINAGNKALKINGNGHNLTYLTIANLHPKEMDIEFKYYLGSGSSLSDCWFGFMLRKDETYDRTFTEDKCAMITLQYKSGSWNGGRLVGYERSIQNVFTQYAPVNGNDVALQLNNWNNIKITSRIRFNAETKQLENVFGMFANGADMGQIIIPTSSLNRYGNISFVQSETSGYLDDIKISVVDTVNKGEARNETPTLDSATYTYSAGNNISAYLDTKDVELVAVALRDPVSLIPQQRLIEGTDYSFNAESGAFVIFNSTLSTLQSGNKYLVIRTGDGVRYGGLLTVTIVIP